VIPGHFFASSWGTPSPLRVLPIKWTAMIILLGSASFISATRTRDYWHNFDDILTGAALGFGCAFFSFWINHNRLKKEDVGEMIRGDELRKDSEV